LLVWFGRERDELYKRKERRPDDGRKEEGGKPSLLFMKKVIVMPQGEKEQRKGGGEKLSQVPEGRKRRRKGCFAADHPPEKKGGERASALRENHFQGAHNGLVDADLRKREEEKVFLGKSWGKKREGAFQVSIWERRETTLFRNHKGNLPPIPRR